jgi:hypothetical protein
MRASSMYSAGAIEGGSLDCWIEQCGIIKYSSDWRKEGRIESWDRGGRTNELYSAVSFLFFFFFCCNTFATSVLLLLQHMPLPIVYYVKNHSESRSRKTSLLLPPSPCKLAAQCHAKFTRVVVCTAETCIGTPRMFTFPNKCYKEPSQ